jgi:N-acetyl-anhydromuramyl-L-alanine amidase AmpD
MREINLIVIHCAATPNGRHFTVNDIDQWHRLRGFNRAYPRINPELTSIGYHYVIYLDGEVHTGRAPEEVGAHAAGHNGHSLGVCLIGTDNFTPAQWAALKKLVLELAGRYPQARLLGHRDLPGVTKACPGFDVASWYQEAMYGGLWSDVT